MSFRLVALTPTIGAAPGESVIGRVEIHNDGTSDAVYTVSVVGLATDALTEMATPPPLRVPVPAGSSVVSDVAVVVPRTLGIGQHAAAFEATSSRSSDRAALTPFTVSIQSVSRVELVPQPSTIRARRKANFHLDVTNNEPLPVDVELTGEAPEVAVSFVPAAVSLQPGQRLVAKGHLRGPRHWSGEPTQHNILITARGRAATTSVTAAYVQRPLFAHRARMVLAAFTVVALWLAAIGGAALWLSNRDDGTDASAEIVGVDTNGDGVPDAFFDANGNPVTASDTDGDGIPDTFVDADGNPIPGTDTDGDGIPDTLVDADGNPIEAVDTNGDGIPDTLSNGAPAPGTDQPATAPEPQTTIVRGTVQIDGDPTSVAVTLTPIELGAAPSPTATPIGLRAAQPSEPEGKIWSARTATLNDLVGSATRRTVAIAPGQTVPGPDGVWLFTDVLQGQSYEVSFSSPGFDTQSFVFTPRADGEPIDLDVTMKPSNGALSGAVLGPSGPIGGAEIQITDGTLDFSTTSASGSGTWSLQGVSTPGVYTITATLRGFATAVRQVQLRPGDTPTGINLQMVPGLGTITGRITSEGTGLGGVTVTASNGDTTLTTTTLTEGDVGSYSLPQLAIPATYTVQAALDGYVTDSRRVPLDGSVSGVDFAMTSTTTTLTGRVLSSAGGGIESAGLVITTGDLQFRASTSPTGVFTIDRLPPGDYTITVEHYLHESVTEFTTLVAGSDPAPLEITLPLSSGPPAVGTGSLVVSVINDDPTIDPPGINNAEVTLSRNRTAEIWKLQDKNASAVTFDDLPIGTYTISVRAEGYNVSAPVTKSVGQTRERAEIQLQKLGQASGIMVNSLDPTQTPLPGYSVTLYRLASVADPTGVPVATFFDDAGTWTTPDTALPTGFYRIEATSPLGYLVRNDQVLDTNPAVGGRPMTFLVPQLTDAEVKPITIAPIQADPYPTITGRIFQPRLNGTAVEYDAIDDPALKVTGDCNGTPIDPAEITITDAFGNSNPPTNDLFDTFSITKETVADAIPADQLPGTCEFTVSAPGRTDAEIQLTNVVPSDGLTSSNRLAAAALVKTPAPLTGTAFWFDFGKNPDQRIPLGGVTITTAAPVITGFASSEASTTVPDPRPIATLGPLTTTSAPNTGAWTLNGQVFGTSTYVFTTTNFTPGSVPVTISEAGRSVPSSGTNANVFTDPAVDGSGFGIELTPPNPGTVSGKVTIQTTSTPKYGTNMVNATDPSSTLREATPDAATGNFSFANAIAGTWSFTFDPLPNHVQEPVTPPPTPDPYRLPPGGSLTGINATYTELATVRVELFDKTTGTAITEDVGFDLTAPATPPLTTGTTSRSPSGPDAGNWYELKGIPVAATSPTNTTVDYLLALQLEGYDLKRASIGSPTGTVIDARKIELPMVAGRVTELTLYIDTYKSITGSLAGRLTGGGTEPLSLAGAVPAPAIPATMIVERVGVDGKPLPPPTDPEELPDPAPTLVPGPNGTFEVTGAPGYYKLTPAHPQYQETPAATPANGAWSGPQGVSLVPNVYWLGSSAPTPLTTAFEFTLRTSTLKVNALTQLTGGEQVEGAVFDRYLGTAPCTAFPATPTRETIPTGGASITIAPGTYCLRISKFRAADNTVVPPVTAKEIAFPAIVTVTVPRSTDGAPGGSTVVAPLPALFPTLQGRLIAQNGSGGEIDLEIDLTVDSAPVITSAFTEVVNVNVNGTTIPNQNANSTGNRSATAVLAGSAWTYTLTDVPYGENKITAPVITGYRPTTETTKTVVVDSSFGPTEGPEFVYILEPPTAPIVFDLGTGTFPSLDPAFKDTDDRANVFLFKSGSSTCNLSAPSPACPPAVSYSFDPTKNTLTVTGVTLQKGDWTLTFDDALHEVFRDEKVKIDQKLNTDGTRTGTLKEKLKGDLVRLTGQVTQRFGAEPTNVSALDGDAVMTLAGSTTYTLAADPPPGTPNSGGTNLFERTYIFDVPQGTYTLTTARTDYFSTVLPNLAVTPNGSMVTRNVEIVKKSKVTVSVATSGLALPPGLRVDLLNTVNGSVEGPLSLPTPTAGKTDVTFEVTAGTYQARTVSDTYPRITTAATVVEIGATPTLNIVLERIARFTITTPGSPNPTPLAGATVKIGTTTSGPANASGVVEYRNAPTTNPLSATVAATGHRTKVVAVPAEIFPTTPVTLLPTVTVSGTITGASDGTITAVNAAVSTDTRSGTITGGSYSIAGLDNNTTNGTDKTWNISYTENGVGTTTTPVTVTVSSTSPTAETKNITLVPRDVNYDFTVTTPGTPAVPVDGATVTVFNSSNTSIGTATTADGTGTAAKGTARITVKENTDPATWVVSKSGYLTQSGTISAPTSSAVPVVLLPQWTVAGTVFDSATTPAAVVGARIDVCPASPATRCTATQPDQTTSTTAGGVFTLSSDLGPGSYRIWASFPATTPTTQGSISLTISATGQATLGAATPPGRITLTAI